MGRALALGWGEPILATDNGSGRAAALVAEVGGEVAANNQDLVARADIIILGHKPHQLEAIARDLDASGKLVVSVMGPTKVTDLQRAYPKSKVVRTLPNTPVAFRKGVTCIVEGGEIAVELFERVGRVFVLPERLMTVANGTIGVTPAYIALIVEAMVDSAVINGLAASLASQMFLSTLAGTAELLASRHGDTLAARREVSSPGEATVRGVAALERAGLRRAFDDAMRAVIERMNLPYDGAPVIARSAQT
jgi:pyrroline-5-carboxylate reductase